jgi:class 3 adenylate cyclase
VPIQANDDDWHPESSQRRHLTVMFCDVVGSTRLSRQRDVEAYFSILRAYYDACGPVVERHGGRIAQHQGDGIYVWFGYPIPKEDDATRAVRAGLDLLVVLRRLSASLEAEVGEPLAVRIAVHAGEALVASVESERAPLAFGHTPNLAAKLHQAAPPGTLVVSGEVLRLVEDSFDVQARDPAVLPDGSVVLVYEVIRERLREGRVGRKWRTPLVGREHERERLQQSWTAVQAGKGAALALVGSPGIGKTRLASTVLAAAGSAQANVNVLDCACSQLDASTAYRSFRTLLVQAAGIEPDDPPIVSAALLQDHLIDRLGMDQRAATVLGAVLGLPREAAGPTLDLDPSKFAQITAELLVEWVVRLAAAAPTVVLVDDVVHADPSSLAVLERLAAARPPRLLLVLTGRSDVALASVLPGSPIEIIELEPLASEVAEALIDAVSVASPLEHPEREQILRQGEGVPFYLEELAKSAQEAVDHMNLPITLTGRLQARLAAPGMDREIVSALAVAGDEVDETVLASVLQTELEQLRDRLGGLLAGDLVVDTGASDPSYRFRHGLITEAAYGLLLHEQRTRLHRRLAEVMTERHASGRPVDWNVVGHHLKLAQRPLDAFEAILTGANEARRSGAISEALQGYRDALDIVEGVTDPGVRDLLEIRCRLQRGIAAISARGFGAEEAVEDFGRCAQLCRQLGPRPEHLSAVTGVYSFYLLQGELAAARQMAEDLRSWVETGHADYRPENALAFGVLSFFEGDYTGAVERLGLAAGQFRTAALDVRTEENWLLPFDPLVATLSHLAPLLWITGRPREAHEAGDRAIARAATLAFPEGPFSMAYAKSYLAWMHAVGGHHETAARFADDVRKIGQRHGFAFWESTGEIHLALARYWTSGQINAADTVMLHASIWEFLRARVFLPYVLTATAEVRAAMGQLAEAVAAYESVGTLVQETGVRFYEAERLRLLARALPSSREESRAALRQAWELAQRQGALLFELRAALDLARLGEDANSAARLRAVIGRFPPGAGYPELNEAQALLARAPTRT